MAPVDVVCIADVSDILTTEIVFPKHGQYILYLDGSIYQKQDTYYHWLPEILFRCQIQWTVKTHASPWENQYLFSYPLGH
jgi:hypothetical protein